MSRRIRWERKSDTCVVAYEHPGHPYKDRPLAWISITEPALLSGVMGAVERVLEAYGTVNPDVRRALNGERP